MDKSDKNLFLQLETKTWSKENDDLFDFESTNIQKKNFLISTDNKFSYIVSNKQQIDLYHSPENLRKQLDNTQKIISEISLNSSKSTFVITNPFSSGNLHRYFEKENCERPWLIISNETPKEINEGDIVKLGRVRLKFDKIVLSLYSPKANLNTIDHYNNSSANIFISHNSKSFNNNTTIISYSNNALNEYQNSRTQEGKYCCKICYMSESDLNNPLISPCKCIGSMKYIHYKCLKSCIESKTEKKVDTDTISYMWNSYNCEICLQPYPKIIKFKNTIYNLIDIDTSKFKEYAILDYCIFEDSKKKIIPKGKIVVKIKEDVGITVGRTQTNEIKLKDISVSRKHCTIMKREGKLYISDLTSKFGTLFYLKKGLEIGQEKNNGDVVSGKHYFSFNVKVKWNLFLSFFSFGCCSYSKEKEDEFVVSYEWELNNSNYNKEKYIAFNEDDTYNDYIMDISKLYLDDDYTISNRNSNL